MGAGLGPLTALMFILLSSKSQKKIIDEFEELVHDVNKLSQPVDNDK